MSIVSLRLFLDVNREPDLCPLDVTPETDLQGEPLFQLIKQARLEEKIRKRSGDPEDAHFLMVCNIFY